MAKINTVRLFHELNHFILAVNRSQASLCDRKSRDRAYEDIPGQGAAIPELQENPAIIFP
jgi:hypothetical protein